MIWLFNIWTHILFSLFFFEIKKKPHCFVNSKARGNHSIDVHKAVHKAVHFFPIYFVALDSLFKGFDWGQPIFFQFIPLVWAVLDSNGVISPCSKGLSEG